MKRVVSLLIAVITTFGIAAGAYAASDDISTVSDQYFPMSRVGYGTSGNEVSYKLNELVIVDDSNKIVGPEYHLDPGEDYVFKIYVAGATQTSIDPGNLTDLAQVTDYMLGGGKFRLRAVKGTSTISSAKVVKKGGGNNATYNLEITTKDTWGTKLTDVEYTLSVTGQTESYAAPLEPGAISFEVGYGQMTDTEIDYYEEGDVIVIDNDYPVITKDQFKTIAKNYNYKAVEFEADDGSWRYTGRVSGMGDTNFSYSHNVIPSIVNKFEDQDFKFLTFGAGVTFPTNGEMRIDVSDVSGEYDNLYTYLYRNGRLTPIATTYDTGADEIVFRTNYLGAFVMTDEQITDTTIIDQGEDKNPAEEIDDEDKTTGENPNTGIGHGVQIAVVLGVVSLAAAGTVSRKRK